MGDEADRRASAARRSPPTASTTRCSTRPRPARSRCTTCPRTPARRSPPRCSTARASASGIRPRTAATRRRRCSSCWSAPRMSGDASDRPTRRDPPSPPAIAAPAARRRARADDRLARLRRRGRRAARRRRLRRVRRRRDPRRPRARGRAQAQAQLRPRAHARGARAEPRAHRAARPTTRACPGRCSPTSASWRSSSEQVDDALRRIGKLDGFELEEIVPALRAVALPQQARVLLRRRRRRRRRQLVCGFHAPAGGNRVTPIEDCLLASERGNQAREVALRWCRAQGLTRLGSRPRRGACRRREGAARASAPARRRRARAPAQPRRARGPPHRQAAGPPRHDRRRAGAGALAAALSEALGEQPLGRAVDALAQPRRDDRGRRDRAGVGRGRAARAPRRARPAHLPRGVLPDQHRDGRACCTGSSPSTPRWRAGSASTTSTAASARSR